jgi:hypothetical protein
MRPLRYKDLTAFGQALYLICALVIFSYVLFDVLDLDGSNFAKIFNSSHRTFIGAFVPAEAEFDFAAKRDSLMTLGAIFVLAALVVTCTGLRLTHGPVSALIRTRAHGSLLAFARNSLPDSIPDH